MRSKIIIAVFAGCLLSGLPAWAGQARRSEIPATAKWVVHFDVQAITNSQIGQGMMDLISDQNSPIPQDKIAKAGKIWDRLNVVTSLTFYGCTYEKADAVVVAKLDYDEADILNMLGVASHGEHKIYNTGKKEHKCRQAAGKHFVCLYDARTIVASGNESSLKDALDLLDGQGKSLTSNDPIGKMLGAKKGTFMVAAIEDVNKMVETLQEKMTEKRPRQGALLAKCRNLRLEVGELDGMIFGEAKATLATMEDAINVQKAAQGMLALGMLAQEENDRLTELLGAVEIKQQDSNCAIQVQLASRDILEGMKDKLEQRSDK